MTIDDQIRDKNYNMKSVERPLKYQLCDQAKLISISMLLVNKCYHLINNK